MKHLIDNIYPGELHESLYSSELSRDSFKAPDDPSFWELVESLELNDIPLDEDFLYDE